MKDRIELSNADNLDIMKFLGDESLDIICIDPPYLYLKNQKLERVFDEQKFFSECKRLLTKKGFIVMFGRGESFYRWNTLLADLGFIFKEEIVWDKMRITSPMNALGRRHETVSIFTKKDGKVNKIKRPLIEAYKFEPKKIEETIYRLQTTFGNRETFDLLKEYYSSGLYHNDEGNERKFNPTLQTDIKKANRTVQFAIKLEEGVMEKSVIQETHDRETIHPTQKPVRLLERLLNLVLPKDKKKIVIADFFAGSMSCMEAVINLQNQNPDKDFTGIATEIDEEYFLAGKERIENILNKELC